MTDDGKYILINYGSVNSRPKEKIKEDIIACFDKAKLSLPKDKIKKLSVDIVPQIFILSSYLLIRKLFKE